MFDTHCWNVLLVFIDKAEISDPKIPKCPINVQKSPKITIFSPQKSQKKIPKSKMSYPKSNFASVATTPANQLQFSLLWLKSIYTSQYSLTHQKSHGLCPRVSLGLGLYFIVHPSSFHNTDLILQNLKLFKVEWKWIVKSRVLGKYGWCSKCLEVRRELYGIDPVDNRPSSN